MLWPLYQLLLCILTLIHQVKLQLHVSKGVNTVSAVAYLRFIQGCLFSQLCLVRFQGPFKSLTLCQFPYYPILHGIYNSPSLPLLKPYLFAQPNPINATISWIIS